MIILEIKIVWLFCVKWFTQTSNDLVISEAVHSEEVGQQFAKIHGSNFDQSRLRKATLLQIMR